MRISQTALQEGDHSFFCVLPDRLVSEITSPKLMAAMHRTGLPEGLPERLLMTVSHLWKLEFKGFLSGKPTFRFSLVTSA